MSSTAKAVCYFNLFVVVLYALETWHALSVNFSYNPIFICFRTLCGCRVRVELSSGEKRSRYRGPPPSWNRRPRDDYRRRSPPARRRYGFFLFSNESRCLKNPSFTVSLVMGRVMSLGVETDKTSIFS